MGDLIKHQTNRRKFMIGMHSKAASFLTRI